MSKRDCQVNHAKKRFLERHGKNLSNNDYRTLVNLIKNNSSKCIRKVSNDYFIYEIKYNGDILYTVYNKSRHSIVTFLLYDELEVKEIEELDLKRDTYRTKNLKVQEDFDKFNSEYLKEMERKELFQIKENIVE